MTENITSFMKITTSRHTKTRTLHLYQNKLILLANRISVLKRPEPMSRFTYRLVAKQDVDVWHDLHQGLFKELADERC